MSSSMPISPSPETTYSMPVFPSNGPTNTSSASQAASLTLDQINEIAEQVQILEDLINGMQNQSADSSQQITQ